MDDFDSFEEFLEGLSKRPAAKLPESILLVRCATPRYYGRNPIEIPDAVPGILEESPAAGTNVVININVVNVTGSAVTLTLWLDENNPPSDYYIFGICGGTVPANGYWQWTGELNLSAGFHIWGQAGAANALYAHIALREPLGSYRRV